MKFLLRINYHNSNQLNNKNSKSDYQKFPTGQLLYNNNPKSNSKTYSEEDFESEKNIEFNFPKNNIRLTNEKSFWEPVLEPMPGKFTYLTTKKNIFIKFEILSLKPTYNGFRRICRQNYFHSLNINLNERLMENINSLLKDNSRINEIMENKELNNNNINNKKTLTILNLTEYFMIIKENPNFKIYEEEDDFKEDIYSNSESENEINTQKKKKIFQFSPERILELKTSYLHNEEPEKLKKKFEFIYKPSKKYMIKMK